MRKKNFLFIVAMVFILMLSGCGKSSTSEPITTTKFKTIMEEKGLEVTDKTDSAKDHSYQEIYVAVDKEKYSFEYYFMKNEKSATNVYKYAVDNLNKTYITLNPQLHSRSATYIKRNGLLIRKITIKSSRPFQCAYHPLTP